MKKEKSVLHLCECILLALVILLIIDLYLLKFLQEPGVSYYPMLRLMEKATVPTSRFPVTISMRTGTGTV